jgi:hypothetical protein
MSKHPGAATLIRELLAEPVGFNKRGRSYDLLQEYFRGYSLETLRDLVRHPDIEVKRAAIWIASELGNRACRLLPDIANILHIENTYLKYHALEVVIVCAEGPDSHHLLHIIKAFGDGDSVIRALAMRLISRADTAQVEALAKLAQREPLLNPDHKEGLEALLAADAGTAVRMLDSQSPLLRKYGAIISRKLSDRFPHLEEYAGNSLDRDISHFVRNP